jgi:hypothetical protein
MQKIPDDRSQSADWFIASKPKPQSNKKRPLLRAFFRSLTEGQLRLDYLVPQGLMAALSWL